MPRSAFDWSDGPLRFELDESQRLVRDSARSFARSVVKPRAAQADKQGRLDDEVLEGLASAGLLGVNVPPELGGPGAGSVAYSLALSEIAAACASTAVTMAVTNMVAETIARHGTESQRLTHVPRLCSGEYRAGAFALSEPDAGSDPASMRTAAHWDGSHWVLEGRKQWITSGDFAKLIVVWARTDGPGARGLSAFLVPAETPGLLVSRREDKLGLRASSTVGLSFEGCRLPETALLGERGEGFKIAMEALDGGRISIGSQCTGIARAALDAAVSYAKQRRQFGKALADLQAIQWMLADSKTELEAMRLLTLRAAYLKQTGQAFSQAAASAKLYASEAAGHICDRALQIHGGYGYTKEFPVERYVRDVRVTRIYEGTSEIQRIVLAREVLR
jgi:alkylation response protein AidB-like acyl-CoA dehydrogenase